MIYGNKIVDGGFYLFTDDQKEDFINDEPMAIKFFKPILSGEEFLNGENRWVLYLKDVLPGDLKKLPKVLERLEAVRKYRLKSTKKQTRDMASFPSLFAEPRQPNNDFLLIPRTSSEARKYIPFSFYSKDFIVNDSCVALPDATLYDFGMLTSEMHMTWVKYVCGRLESRFRYSNTIVYNNYPFPENITDKQKQKVETCAQKVLDTRAKYPNSSLADLYNPLTMPPDLTKAHQNLDKAVDLCYRPQPFVSELNRIEFLFNLYENLTAPLLKTEKKKRTKKAKNSITNQDSDITD